MEKIRKTRLTSGAIGALLGVVCGVICLIGLAVPAPGFHPSTPNKGALGTPMRIVADETGRSLRLPDHPHRIVCLAPSITDTVYAIGAGADVVAISDFTLYPAEALQKPSIGGVLRPSLERIAVLHP